MIAQFSAERLGFEYRDRESDPDVGQADRKHFADVVLGVVGRQTTIDKSLDAALAKGWPLDRLDATVRAILRCGTYELGFRSDIPARVILGEYVDVAGAFFEGEEVRFVSGVLNGVARNLRAAEFEAPQG